MVSVAMATYNGSKYIREQLDSILSQLSPEDELIVSDNCSTDDTLEIINSYKDERIKIFSFPRQPQLIRTRLGIEKTISKNFENALKHCSGDYIFYSDQDDIWFGDKIAKMLPYLNKYSMVMSNTTTIDGDGNVIKERLYNKNPLKHGIFSFRSRGSLLGITRELLIDFLPIPESVSPHDLWTGILAEMKGSYFFLDEPLIYHRREIGNFSTDVTQKSNNTLFYKIYYRINLLWHCFWRLTTRKRW